MAVEDSPTWQRAFGYVDGEPGRDEREALRAAWHQLRRQVEPVAADIALSVPNYTDHSILHCDSLWDITDLLIDDSYPLNPAEAFVLGGAFLIHDLGMGLSAYPGGLAEILHRQDWLDLLAEVHPKAHHELQEQAVDDVQSNPTWDGLTSQEVKQVLTQFLRDHHAGQAEKVLSQAWRLTSGQEIYLLPDTELRHWYGGLIGRLAQSHWRDIDELDGLFAKMRGAPPNLPPTWTIDPLKLACLLRVADAAQIDARRADPLHTPFRQPQGTSREHWLFQERMLHPQVQNNRLVYSSSIEFSVDQAPSWWLAFDTVQMIDRELRQVDALSSDLGRPQLRVNAVAGAESARRFAEYVATEEWIPIDARPRISDTSAVISNLGGEALYGRNHSIVVRELLANAVDATRIRRAAYGKDGLRPVRVALTAGAGSPELVVRDYGIGMTTDDIVTYLCDFGQSGWRSKAVRLQHPGALASGYTATGRYGIGFYSCFMVADRVTVRSRAFHESSTDTSILEFFEGLEQRPVLRKAGRDELLYEPGTVITVQLRKQVTEEDGLFYGWRPADVARRLPEFVRHLALLCDEVVEVSADEDEIQRVVGDVPWREISNEVLFDALSSGDEVDPSIEEARADARTYFSRLARPVYDDDGVIQGRIALEQVAYRSGRMSRFTLPWAGVYCAGFWAEGKYGISGVLEGTPTKASRDSAEPVITLSEWRRWFLEQLDLLPANGVSEEDQLELAASGCALGLQMEDLPLAIESRLALKPRDLLEWATERPVVSLLMVSGFTSFKTEQGSNAFFDFLSSKIVPVPPDSLIVRGRRETRLDRSFTAEDCSILDDIDTETLTQEQEAMVSWWRVNCSSVEAEIFRILAKAWRKELKQIVMSATLGWSDLRPDSGIAAQALDGTEVRVSGITIGRQAAAQGG